MTTIEHALLGANLVLAAGLEKKFGWQVVGLVALCANVPDWDGLTFFWSTSLFDTAHRAWGHNLLACSLLAAVLAVIDWRFDFITRAARFLVRWTKFVIPNEKVMIEPRVAAKTRAGFLAVWIGVALVAAWSHIAADLVFSGSETLSDWGLQLLWPFSDREFVYPMISWGDVGVIVIFVLGLFAMLRWKNRTTWIARATLLAALGYVLL